MFKYFYDLGGETSTPEPSEETDASDVASNNNNTSLYSQQLNFSTAGDRSEEHTSELQSPVPISYAVFCLKKKNKKLKYKKKSFKNNTTSKCKSVSLDTL